jgi:hypothetical protein
MSQPEMKNNQNGTKRWYLHGKFHREDGPAIEHSDGEKRWFLNDKLHREDGPAVEFADGRKYWFLHGKYHREDGPDVEYPDGRKCWYLNSEEVTWEQVFRQAKNPEIELRILSAALTNA